LLLDEPFGALDAKVRQELRRWLRALHAKIPVTSVLVTHDQEEALEVADRIVIMNQGRIEQTGTPDEVFHNPASEFVVTFLGNVNLFHGRHGANGQAARVFVRPHELDIERAPSNGESVFARVLRIQSAGPLVRVELTTEQDDPITVELTHDRYREMTLKTGDPVYVKVRDVRVFVAAN
jgi:sulfate transport system ATP-binding protein